ncbi:hypothetical protein [Tumebacillus permanentifrigoris]|uniref:KOW motif-containing protein n=1 Tax=Tumebacillus permanentifrigoris TaxID=378543 RepID=A0A316DEX2_9BACL|nr:hypothetical protein [Tumebacillus permanentifrigoris]PWK15729.1 hypothetical protein C7459_103281 [Tumebacillus permanentifrigoris]
MTGKYVKIKTVDNKDHKGEVERLADGMITVIVTGLRNRKVHFPLSSIISIEEEEK